MNTEARREWLIAAYAALSHLPVDLLARGAKAAMGIADHPSRIVPAILEETRQAYETRRRLGPSTHHAPTVPQIEAKSSEQKFADWIGAIKAGSITQDAVDAAPERWRRIAYEQGHLRRRDDGTFETRKKGEI